MKMDDLLLKLNSEQREAVLDESRACLVNANVGSGKTTVLIAKVRYLHYVKQVPYSQMAVVTFTSKAAGEIRERLQREAAHAGSSADGIGPSEGTCAGENSDVGTEGLDPEDLRYFGTFHSLAMTLLREDLPVGQLGADSHFQVMTPEEEMETALRLIRREKLNIKYKNRLKKRLETETESRYDDDLDRLRGLLSKEKLKQNKLNFDDLIRDTALLLKQSPVSVRWLIIDEVQDCDSLQLELIHALMTEETHLFALGDQNQAIYSFRGGSVNIFHRLKERYPARELTLSVNYRSTDAILKVAGYFKMSGAKLVGSSGQGSLILVRQQYDAFQDALYIAQRIRELHSQGLEYRQMAVFYRLQSQSEVFEHVLMKENIPFTTSLRRNVQDIPVLNWLIHALKYATDQRDTASAYQVLTDKSYGPRLTAARAEKALTAESAGLLRDLRNFMTLCEHASGNPCGNMSDAPHETVSVDLYDPDFIMKALHLDSYLHPTAVTYAQDHQDVCTFLKSICRDMQEVRGTFSERLIQVLNLASLYGAGYARELYEDIQGVRLMTLHASKGLEFKAVFITGVNNGLIPLKGGRDTDEDEERRLLFVGMTRAKEILELSCYTEPAMPGVQGGPGKFIRSIPPKYMHSETEAIGTTGIQQLRRLMQEEKRKMQAASEPEMIRTAATQAAGTVEATQATGVADMAETSGDGPRQVRIGKYGVGTVTGEDEMTIRVIFPGYGEKEFMKAFTVVEDIP